MRASKALNTSFDLKGSRIVRLKTDILRLKVDIAMVHEFRWRLKDYCAGVESVE